jgi:enoyl-CoA hydratase/carnithine racemase
LPIPRPARRPAARSERPLEVERRDGLVYLTMGGSASGPVLDADLHAELCAAAEAIDLDEEARVAVLAARGRCFCAAAAGADLRPVAADGVAAISALRVPVVALLQGDALDAGMELALACDLRLAVPQARLGLTQVTRGSLPHHGGTQRLPRVVGRARALRMILLGERVRARDAQAMGLVHSVVAPRTLASRGEALARALAERGPIAQRLAKEALGAALDLPLAEGLRLEGDLYVLLQSTRDRDEGIASFREKRRPRFTGR